MLLQNIPSFFSVANRTVLISGAGGLIGFGLTKMFAESGACVYAADLALDPMRERFAPLLSSGFDIHFLAYDVASSAETQAAIQQIEADGRHVDIEINNAGFRRTMIKDRPELTNRLKTAEVPEEIWRKMFDINLGGVMVAMQAVLPGMVRRGYGRIINIASIAGEVGLPGYPEYSASKSGVIGLTRTAAMEYAKQGITVNSISPGLVGKSERFATDATWVGFSGTPEDVARAALFLASDEAGFITGIDLPVEGGRILGPHNCDME